MRITCFLILWLTASTSVFAHDPDCRAETLLLKGGKVWLHGEGLVPRDLLLRNGRIEAILPGSGEEDRTGATVVDASKLQILPGLIDLHTHFYELGGPLPAAIDKEHIERNFKAIGRSLITAGVTWSRAHLMNLENGPQLAGMARDDCFPAPRIDFAGPGLFGGLPDTERFQVWGVRSVEDARAKVLRIAESGAGWVAIHRAAHFEPGELKAIAASARRHGLKMLGAGDSPENLLALLEIHPNTIDYLPRTAGSSLPEEVARRLSKLSDPPLFVPMISAPQDDLAARRSGQIHFGPLAQWLPEDAIQRVRRDLEESYSTPPDADWAAWVPQVGELFAQYRSLGLPLGIGTDSGSPAHFHYRAIWREMAYWSDNGASPEEILSAATIHPAQVLGHDHIGAIRVGNRADLVLYSGDIDAGDFDEKKVFATLKGGEIHRH